MAAARGEPPRCDSPRASPVPWSPENRTRGGVMMDVPDMDALVAAMETQGAADAMEYDGVLPETLVILVEA